GFPPRIQLRPDVGELSWSSHATRELRKDSPAPPPPRLSADARLIEISVNPDGTPQRWVFRQLLSAATHLGPSLDIVLVVEASGRVVTAWVNETNDHHRTLDARQYARP